MSIKHLLHCIIVSSFIFLNLGCLIDRFVDENLIILLLELLSIGWLTVLSYSLNYILNGSVVRFRWSLESLSSLASSFSPQARSTAEATYVDFGRAIKIERVKQFHHLLFMLSGY